MSYYSIDIVILKDVKYNDVFPYHKQYFLTISYLGKNPRFTICISL